MLAVRAGSLFLFVTFPDHLAASEVKVFSEGMVLSVQVSLIMVPVGPRLIVVLYWGACSQESQCP